MANRDMKVSVLVQLIDRLTAPLRGITRGIAGMANSIGDLGRRIGVIGGALAALSFMQPIQQAAAWDAQLRDIAITAGKTGGAVEEMIAESGKRYEKLALEVGQRSGDLAKGAQLLVASGMDSGLIDKLMPTIGRVATAANATIEDTAKTAFALSDTLKVAPEQMEEAMGKLITAGKLGRFEFKNMASEFPGLTNQMAKFGITGMEAVESLGASLQIAMLGTANPSEAANNLKNFLTKINAPEAIKKFEKELKVDVTGVMTDAAAKGINPVEAVIQKMSDKLKVPTAEIDKIMKKAGASNMSDKDKEATIRKQVAQLISGTKVGKLYSDMQVLDFLIPTLLNLDKLKDFKRQVKEAGVDVIGQDFESRMRGLSQNILMFSELGTQAMRRIGLAFASNLPMANRALTALLQAVMAIDAKWPGLIDATLSWVGALLLLGSALAVLTPVMSALAGLIGALVSPFVLAAAAIAGTAAVIYRNWETLGPFFSILFDSIKQIGKGFVEFWEGLFSSDFARAADGARAVWDGVKQYFATAWQIIVSTFRLGVVEIDKILGTELLAVFQRVQDGFSAAWDAVKSKMDEVVASFREFPAYLVATFGELPGLLQQAGANAIQGLWDGMKAKFDELISWFKGKLDQLKSMLSIGGAMPGAPGGTNVDPMGNPTGGFNPTSAPGGGIGGSNGFTRTAGGPAANSNVQVGGVITVQAAEGTRVTNIQSENPAVPITPNRGTMLGRA
ncbi:phage tail tape measure protein [Bosea sp. 685]|uniref:phage tail tape measure protein n=1 Tax=Bosea sp. 685 TaxID=3080057 RepID=UPI002892F11B|nr:phage tail tape measure protein [Bosea sp. 685]WNJ89172.1 phage tail tape measure protein [Bosea sp. 685]